MTDLSPQYNPKDVEERLYQQWESAGLFHAEPDPSRQPDRWIGDSHLGDSQLRGGGSYFDGLTADHSSGNLTLPSVPQDATQEGLEDPAEVFQALAEGLQVAMAGSVV